MTASYLLCHLMTRGR